MVDRNIPWAFTMGNHDGEADLAPIQIVHLDQTYALSQTKTGPKNIDGVTNYVLPIFSGNNSVSTNIWFFDSGYTKCMGHSGYGCVERSQVDWYKTHSEQIKNSDGIIPALSFIHIPLQEVTAEILLLIINSTWMFGITRKQLDL
jgi:hypothetical protein